SPDEHDVSVRFIATATGGTSGMRAQTTFTDAGDAADGFGTMTVSPTSAVAGQSLSAVTFTFAVPANGSKTYNDNSTASTVVPSDHADGAPREPSAVRYFGHLHRDGR